MGTPRVRTSGSTLAPASIATRERKYWGNSANYTLSVEEFIGEATTQSTRTDDVVTPNFKRRSAAGEIINNDFYRKTTTYYPPVPTPFTMNYVHKNGDGTYEGSEFSGEYVYHGDNLGAFLPAELPADALVAKEIAVQQAVTEAHANVSALELSLPMVAAEAHKTLSSLSSISYRAYKIFKAIRRLDVKYLRRQISRQELEERYMELRYALRPLVYDAEGLVKALEASKSYSTQRRTARASRSFNWTVQDTIPYTGQWSTLSSSTVTRTREYRCIIRAGVLSDVRTSNVNVWGADSLLQTAWEIVPFSFIADWFVNIGDTLAAHVPKTGITELASWVSIKGSDTWSNSFDLQGFSYDPTYHNHKMNASFSASKKRVETFNWRGANPNLSVWPTVDVKLNPLKLLDLAIITKKMGNVSRFRN